MTVARVVQLPKSACLHSLSSEQVLSDKDLSVVDQLRILTSIWLCMSQGQLESLGVGGGEGISLK